MDDNELKQQKDRRDKEDQVISSEAKSPPISFQESQFDIDEISARLQRREIDLDDEERQDLAKKCTLIIDHWKNNTSGLSRKLKKWNDRFEGVSVVSNFPWVGSCYDKFTEVLTLEGWKKFPDVTKNDWVYSFNWQAKKGKTCCSYQPVTAIQKFKAKELTHFSGKSLDLAVTPNHNMFVWDQIEQKHKMVKAEHFLRIDGWQFKIPIANSGWKAESVEKIYGFDAEDWMTFLGWYLSEGYCLISYRHRPTFFPRIFICQSKKANPGKCLEIEELLDRMKVEFSYDGKQYSLASPDIPQEAKLLLASLGDSKTKRIPKHFLNYSQDLLGCLFEALIKGDGYVVKPNLNSFRKKESFIYYTISKQLADDVQELAQKIGFNATIREREPCVGGEIKGRQIKGESRAYEVSVGIKKRIKIGALKKKIVKYDDFVYCVTTPYHTLLVRRNGKMAWCGNSNTDIPLAKIKSRELRSVINRSVMRPTPFYMLKASGPNEINQAFRDNAHEIENFLEDSIKRQTNVHSTLVKSINVITRDGTCPIQITWESDWERVSDSKVYLDIQEFLNDYPSAEEAGLTDKEFNKIIEKLTQGQSHEILFEYDIANYDGPRAQIVPLIDFVYFPVFISQLEDSQCHGKRIWFTDYQVEDMYSKKKFNDKEQVENLVKGAGDSHEDDYVHARDSIEGISRDYNQTEAKEYEFYELVYRGSVLKSEKKEGIKRKYLVYFHYPSRQIFRVEPYPIRKGRISYFLLRYILRDNRLLGQSLIDDGDDIFEEINIVHRQRINSRTVTHVPTFLAKDAAKDRFDPSNPRLSFRPGRVFWVKEMDDVKQFDIRPVDLSGSVDEEMLLFQLVDFIFGSTSGISGQANPMDPRAPARKQAQLIRMSTNRIEDLTEPLIPEFSKIGQHIIDLYYQYAKNRIKYYVTDENDEVIEREMERAKLFNPNVTFSVRGTNIFTNPEEEFQRAMEVETVIAQNPITSQNPRIRKISYKAILSASRTPDIKDLIPTEQELPTQILSEEEGEAKLKSILQKQKAAERLSEQKEKIQGLREQELIRQVGQIEAKAMGAPLKLPGGEAGTTPTTPLQTAEGTIGSPLE